MIIHYEGVSPFIYYWYEGTYLIDLCHGTAAPLYWGSPSVVAACGGRRGAEGLPAITLPLARRRRLVAHRKQSGNYLVDCDLLTSHNPFDISLKTIVAVTRGL